MSVRSVGVNRICALQSRKREGRCKMSFFATFLSLQRPHLTAVWRHRLDLSQLSDANVRDPGQTRYKLAEDIVQAEERA